MNEENKNLASFYANPPTRAWVESLMKQMEVGVGSNIKVLEDKLSKLEVKAVADKSELEGALRAQKASAAADKETLEANIKELKAEVSELKAKAVADKSELEGELRAQKASAVEDKEALEANIKKLKAEISEQDKRNKQLAEKLNAVWTENGGNIQLALGIIAKELDKAKTTNWDTVVWEFKKLSEHIGKGLEESRSVRSTWGASDVQRFYKSTVTSDLVGKEYGEPTVAAELQAKSFLFHPGR